MRQPGPDTIGRLITASHRRNAEADWLFEGKHNLASIYLYGYVAEMVLGTAYFAMAGFGRNDPISVDRLKRAVSAARTRSNMQDRSHPIDGWGKLLIEERAAVYAPAYEAKIARLLLDRSSAISEVWSPRIRYRGFDVAVSEVEPVRESARWF